ncbi:TPA: hypothetical protein ACHAI6_002814, partial [Enterococcus faecium]
NELSQNIVRIVTILIFQLFLVLIKEVYGYIKTIYAFEVDLSMKIDFLKVLQKKNLFFRKRSIQEKFNLGCFRIFLLS